MIRKFVDSFYLDAVAFALLVIIGCIWAITAFGQAIVPPANSSLLVNVMATATGSTGAVTATTPIVAGHLVYICGFDVSAAGGTATISPITISGLQIGPFTYQGISAGGAPFTHTFTPCLPAFSNATQITVNTTADGTATAVNVQLWGYAYPIP